ncbi:MAG: multiprotein bridging factor aMBF1 [Nanoarchaeota archaeon]
MPLCDMCGKNASTFRVNIENAMLSVCEECSRFGSNPEKIPEIKQEPKKELIKSSSPEQMEIITQDFSQKIKQAREKLNLKQIELANKISEKESIIHKLESAQLIPNRDLAKKLEKFLNIKLIDLKTVSPELLAFLWLLIENESNIMIIGGTGAGKTSFLNAIAFFIPPASRIVSIEDTREIALLHENWLPSVARESTTIEQKGEIDLFALLRESFRQRPDYVIVGEVRGKEAFVMFQGMSAGHPTFGTMHAEDVDTMIRRLESPPIELSPSLIASLDAVCIIVQTKVMDKEVRRLKEVVEIVGVEKENVTLNKPFVWDPRNDMFYFKTDSKIFDKIALHRGIIKERLNQEFRLRSHLLLKMYRNKIFGFKEVQDIINEYEKNPVQDETTKFS